MSAVEKLSVTESLARLSEIRKYAVRLIARLEAVRPPNHGDRILEVGAAAGCLTIALNDMGYQCVGIEPDADALKTARELSSRINRECAVVEGRAERIPFPDQSFDIVLANSVLEHVSDVDTCLSEISRVLRPGGLFWFETASSMSPFQREIRKFPLFGWYPDSLKKSIMRWAAQHHPELVGYTTAPAMNWFSDRVVHRKLRAAGFGAIIDRWALRRENEGGRLYSAALRLIRSSRIITSLANMVLADCAYAAVKEI